jgi:hypothetical protein
MKNFKTRFLALCGLMILLAAALAPIVAEASCPQIIVQCSNGSEHSCNGKSNGSGGCVYSESCLNC